MRFDDMWISCVRDRFLSVSRRYLLEGAMGSSGMGASSAEGDGAVRRETFTRPTDSSRCRFMSSKASRSAT